MKLRLFFVLIILGLLFISCAEEPEEESNTDYSNETIEGLGSKLIGAVTKNGYDYNGNLEVVATVTPYQKGFKILFNPVNNPFICTVLNYVVQGSNQMEIGSIADTEADYNKYDYYNGYVESGLFNSCGYYAVDTVWVVFSDDVGFNPRSPYQVILDDITSNGFSAQVFDVTPVEDNSLPSNSPSNIYLRFNAGTDAVSVPTSSSLLIDNQITVEAYVNSLGSGGIGPVIAQVIDTFSLFYYQNQVWFSLKDSNTMSWTQITSTQPPDNTWTHVAGTWDGSTMRLFVNGILVNSTPFSGPINHSGPGDRSLKIGNGWTLIDGFNGYIDEVRLSDTARYTTAFTPQSNCLNDANTVGLWHFDENDYNSMTIIDSSANNNNGTLSGGNWIQE